MKFKISRSIVLDYIDGFKKYHPDEIIDLFSNGYCYQFAIILHERFSRAGTIMYIPVYNHFCYKLFGRVYDITGEIVDEEKLKLMEAWNIYREKDDLEADRILKDCILKLPDEEE